MRASIILFLLLALAGCDQPKYHHDQALRTRLFFRCLQALPAGPRSTQYNDWNEVVSECGDQAYDMATRCVSNCE